VIGARAHGLTAVGVLWGYGSREELTAAGADVLVDTPAELEAVLRRS
jgi:phosphoglycolate phosphatase